jgi:hypothetical protein
MHPKRGFVQNITMLLRRYQVAKKLSYFCSLQKNYPKKIIGENSPNLVALAALVGE